MIGSHNKRIVNSILKFSGLIITVWLYCAAVPSSTAQERSGFGTEDLKGQDELNPHMDSPANNANATGSNNSLNPISKEKENYRDTISVKPITGVRSKPDSPTQKKPDEETLSFNFLYFIIQKFKVSDMMN